jgi:BirA family transcriptional regulator, biotin operon repressor / biotin---[acetyl-CoA-carboxylase] ligase
MIGLPRVHFRLIDSTNERARELALAGAPHGTLVSADEQVAGRGRQGRIWTAPPRSAVLMSVVLRELSPLVTLAAAVATCEACENAAGASCTIKWPNDIWLDGRKAAGILVEGRPQEGWAVLGIGLNVRISPEQFPPELRETATSVPGSPDPEEMLSELLERLDAWLAAPPDDVLTAWGDRDALRGRQVSWDGGEGKAAGIDDAGALLVDTSDGQIALDAGEVHLGPA